MIVSIRSARPVHPLIINVDETGLKLVPVSNWTLEEQGTAKMKVAGVDDKKEITGVVAASMTGDLLALQLLYGGVSDQ